MMSSRFSTHKRAWRLLRFPRRFQRGDHESIQVWGRNGGGAADSDLMVIFIDHCLTSLLWNRPFRLYRSGPRYQIQRMAETLRMALGRQHRGWQSYSGWPGARTILPFQTFALSHPSLS